MLPVTASSDRASMAKPNVKQAQHAVERIVSKLKSQMGENSSDCDRSYAMNSAIERSMLGVPLSHTH